MFDSLLSKFLAFPRRLFTHNSRESCNFKIFEHINLQIFLPFVNVPSVQHLKKMSPTSTSRSLPTNTPLLRIPHPFSLPLLGKKLRDTQPPPREISENPSDHHRHRPALSAATSKKYSSQLSHSLSRQRQRSCVTRRATGSPSLLPSVSLFLSLRRPLCMARAEHAEPQSAFVRRGTRTQEREERERVFAAIHTLATHKHT